MTGEAPIAPRTGRGVAGLVAGWFFDPVPGARLAVTRAAIATYALVYLGVRSEHFLQMLGYDRRAFAPIGVATLLAEPLTAPLVVGLHLGALALCAGLAMGWRVRITAPLAALAVLWVTTYRNCWGMIFHTDNLLVLHLAVLAVAPAATAGVWRPRERRFEAGAQTVSGWPLRLLCLLTVLTYVVAGVAKLRVSGLGWLSGEVLREQLASDTLRKIELGSVHSPLGAWLVGVPWVFAPLAWLTLLMELGAPLALLGRRLGLAWCGLAWAFHAGVLLLMAIVFAYPLSGVAFLPFLRAERLPGWRPGARTGARATGG